jgi:hypothetical protein
LAHLMWVFHLLILLFTFVVVRTTLIFTGSFEIYCT